MHFCLYAHVAPYDQIKLRATGCLCETERDDDRRTRVDQIARVVFHVAIDRSESEAA